MNARIFFDHYFRTNNKYTRDSVMHPDLAEEGGFEPPHTGIKTQCLNRLTTPHLYFLLNHLTDVVPKFRHNIPAMYQ